jgi:hypothetical protein
LLTAAPTCSLARIRNIPQVIARRAVSPVAKETPRDAGDVHGGRLLYRKSILKNIRYPEVNLAEDAALLQQAIRRDKRLMRLENAGTFVYLRHGRNAWKFETGRFLDPAGWSPTTAPSGFSPQTFDLYRAAVEKANFGA